MFKKNAAVMGFPIGHFISTTDGSVVTTGTPTCKRLLDGVGAACANAASYNATAGVWEIDLDAADMNGDMVGLVFTLADCLPISYAIRTSENLVGVAQTGDSYARLGAPAGASVSADIAAVKAQIGAGLSAQQVRDALKLAPTAGAAADGSIDDLLTDMPAAVEAALSGYQVIVQSAVSTDGQITVYQGYDYAAADDRAIEFEVATPDFTGATTALKFDGDMYAGAVVNPGLTTQLLRFEFTAVQTAAMTAGYHAYRLEVTRAGRLLLEETGVINVKE